MYNAVDVAYYITNYSAERNNAITHLKLQKLLYLVQAFYVTCTFSHRPCFEEPIEAWDRGPVVRKVYNIFKKYGSSPISEVKEYLTSNDDSEWILDSKKFNKKNFRFMDRKIIEFIVNHFEKYSADDLVELTHSQDPWRNAHKQGSYSEITNDSIRKYFANA